MCLLSHFLRLAFTVNFIIFPRVLVGLEVSHPFVFLSFFQSLVGFQVSIERNKLHFSVFEAVVSVLLYTQKVAMIRDGLIFRNDRSFVRSDQC